MPPPKKRLKKVAPPRKRSGIARFLLRVGVVAAIWGGVVAGVYVGYCAIDLPDVHEVTQPPRRPSVALEAEDGTIFARYGDLIGEHVTLDSIPAYVPEAIIAIEDRRFYHHFGIDLLGILRAVVRNVVAGHTVQGGSTLTQQLAKNLFLSPERTLKRKVQEMLLAFWLEHTYTKDQILTAYLNRVYLGSGAYGVDAAARIYFNKPASELNVREAAIIAGLLRAPSRFSPKRDQVQSMERAKVVLQAMVDEGYITDAQRNKAIAGGPSQGHKTADGNDGHYFADWVYDQLGPLIADTQQDMIVKTTLDLPLEKMAERDVEDILSKQGEARDVSEAALITVAPDGAVRALTGGRDYRESQFNRATQAERQPGSSFKPIVYLAAIEQGLTPDDIIPDAPITIGDYSPADYEGRYLGPITARQALAESINTVAVRVLERAGVGNVIQTAQDLGISSPLEHDAALALGASEVTPLEMATVYASLASGGRAITPYAIKEIDSRSGQVLYRHNNVTPPQVVNADAVATLTGMMEDVVKDGTGKAASLGSRPVAGKTGTTSDYHDAWFAGFTADYTTVVWMGNDDNSSMRKVTGGSLPAQLWHNYMTEAERGLPEADLKTGGSLAQKIIDGAGAVTTGVSDAFGAFIESVVGGKR
ncbi:MAG: PBP1A family penicillin-binding protein [Alphaproteobacteria bacterium]|nr:PBP1A family penicillin-binding protein [Alphaproteobacteria bacterium]